MDWERTASMSTADESAVAPLRSSRPKEDTVQITPVEGPVFEPANVTVYMRDKVIFAVTPDRELIVADDIYEAAKAFWEVVRALTPKDYSFEVAKE